MPVEYCQRNWSSVLVYTRIYNADLKSQRIEVDGLSFARNMIFYIADSMTGCVYSSLGPVVQQRLDHNINMFINL